MKLIFNDATEIIVQQVESHGDYLRILTVGNTPEQLKVLFTDQSRTAHMIIQGGDNDRGTSHQCRGCC